MNGYLESEIIGETTSHCICPGSYMFSMSVQGIRQVVDYFMERNGTKL